MVLKINDRLRNRVVSFFTEYRLNLRYDSIGSTFSLSYYFDPFNPEHKEFSCVGHFHLCTLEDEDGELILTGQLLSQRFKSSSKKELTLVGGYSLPGVLEDCEIPISKELTLQSDGLTIREIIQKYIAPFKLKLVIEAAASSAMEEVIETSIAKEGQTIKSYFSSICSQRNIILTHNAKGNLVATKASSNQVPIFHFDKTSGTLSGVEMEFAFNGQGIHSEITALLQADDEGENAGEYTIQNPWCPIVYRPHTVSQSSGDENDTETVARNVLAAELRNISLTVTMDRFKLAGKIPRPGQIISVTDPELYLYKKTDWMISEIDFSENATSKSAVLRCVPKEVYTGEYPTYFFKGINLH